MCFTTPAPETGASTISPPALEPSYDITKAGTFQIIILAEFIYNFSKIQQGHRLLFLLFSFLFQILNSKGKWGMW